MGCGSERRAASQELCRAVGCGKHAFCKEIIIYSPTPEIQCFGPALVTQCWSCREEEQEDAGGEEGEVKRLGGGVGFSFLSPLCDHSKLLYDYTEVSQQSGNNLPQINRGGNCGHDVGSSPC